MAAVSEESTIAGQRSAGFVVLAAGVTAIPWLISLGFTQVHVPGNRQAMVVLAAWLGIPHVAATVVFYGDREMRPMLRGPRYWTVPVLLVAGSACLAVIGALNLLLIANVLWTLHHFAKQNLGMVAFTARAAGMPGPRPVDRGVIVCTGVAAMLGYSSILIGDLGWNLPTRPLQAAGLLVLAGCAVVAVGSPCRPLMLVACVFFLPLFLDVGVVPAVVAYTAAHGAQYLLMTGTIARRSARLACVLAGSVLVGGFVLRYGSVQHQGWLYGLAVGATFAHFVIDAGVWRMTTPEKRAYMRGRFSFL